MGPVSLCVAVPLQVLRQEALLLNLGGAGSEKEQLVRCSCRALIFFSPGSAGCCYSRSLASCSLQERKAGPGSEKAWRQHCSGNFAQTAYFRAGRQYVTWVEVQPPQIEEVEDDRNAGWKGRRKPVLCPEGPPLSSVTK